MTDASTARPRSLPGRALAPYRVIDLTTERAWMAGRMLADLGADVIKVEPPGGDPGRAHGRFADDSGDPDDNLTWWFQNRGKRSVTLDLDDSADRQRLLGLIDGSDAVLESFDIGWLDERGLGPASLLDRDPHLVVTSVSAWGQTGPKANHRATDLTISAACGSAWLNGDPDRPPVRSSAPQFWRHAGAEAAVNTAMALHHAAETGRGQTIDVSAQLAGIRTLMNATGFPPVAGIDIHRAGPYNPFSPVPFRMVVATADGHVTIHPAAGKIGGPGMNYLLGEAAKEVGIPQMLEGIDYTDFDLEDVLNDDSPVEGSPADTFTAIGDALAAYIAGHTKAELYEAAIEHRLLMAPVNTVSDVRVDAQRADRGYFVEVDHGDRGPVVEAGPWARLSATPLMPPTRAPLRGEHSEEILAEPGRRPAPVRNPTTDRDQIFEGLKVWDMSWVGVGPMTGRYLADQGATVVRLDHSSRPDVLRLAQPFNGGAPHLNASQFYADFNASKLSLGLDITTEAGREIVLEMAKWADVVLESFTPRALRSLEIDYQHLQAVNPSLVMLSTCMQGQTGPRAEFRGFGNLMASLTGFYEVTGWPDRDPQMIFGAYTDFISQRFCATAVVAALDHRARTGEGQHIDVSQMEAGLQFLGPEMLDYEVNGRAARRMGNHDLDMAPHGVYPCRPTGDRAEAWVAIAVEDDERWSELERRLGHPSWAADQRYDTAAGRRAEADTLDEHLGQWTSTRTTDEVVDALQPAVAATGVLDQSGLYADPQILDRGYFVPLEHTAFGEAPYNGLQAELSLTPGRLSKAAPCCGEDTWMVLTDLLGMSEEEVTALLIDEVVEIT
ncbi:MAG: CoA transferase [Actinomycetia bacterium]|nr:CoA transferase [Actinomycetes bacterium]